MYSKTGGSSLTELLTKIEITVTLPRHKYQIRV